MLRFCGKNFVDRNEGYNVDVIGRIQMSGEGTWQEGKECFRRGENQELLTLQMVSVLDAEEEIFCYGWQDAEANRELRMLKELEEIPDVISFHTVFPDIKEVVVCGCNELAYYFVLYLQKQKINVSVSGKYWNFFGYENNTSCGLGGKGTMVINAEEISLQTDSLYQTVIRSASSCFECVDQIYEANMAEGKIRNTIGNFEEILEKIRGRNVAILGTNMTAQDTYDLLYGHGIDICCFAVFESMEKGECRTLLGKKVVGVEEIIKNGEDMVFIDNNNQNSALGTGNSDIFDYYGYERNESFFLLRDYTEIPCSCLKHVLNGRRVLLAGDERLCSILLDYLVKVNQGNVDIQYTDILSACSGTHQNPLPQRRFLHYWIFLIPFLLAHSRAIQNPAVMPDRR